MRNITKRFSRPFSASLRMLGLLALFAMLPVTQGHSQTGTVGIGSGTANNSFYLPMRAYYGYSYTQQIVSASEYAASGGVAGPITKMRYYISNISTPLANWNNWTVYIGHTSKTSFASTTDWEPVSNLTQVFTGTVTQVAANWIELTFSTPFNYDGVSNLLVAMDENATSYSDNEVYFGSYTGAANTGIYHYSDTVNANPTTPPTATGRTSTLARIQFVGTVASCLAPTAVTSVGSSTTTGSVSWTASTSNPTSGYQYYYSTDNTAPTASTTPSGSVAAGTTTSPISGLQSNTMYYVWVRSNCGGGTFSSWSASTSFRTPCDAIGVPYVEDFDGVTTPALPDCTLNQNVGAGNNWGTSAPANYGFDTNALTYLYSSSNAANTWFMTRGLNLVGGTSYRLSYKYGSNSNTYNEKLKVALGTAQAAATMTTILADHPTINFNVAVTNTVDFVAPATGVYYIGFNVYSIANQYNLYIDDILVDVSPSCLAPSALTSSNIGETGATLSWTASTSAPASGYQYYYSDMNTAPDNGTPISGTTAAGVVTKTLANLASATKYYFWVRSDCGNGSTSEWGGPYAFTTLCDAPDILTTTPGAICGQGNATLQATSNGGVLNWYSAATGGTMLGTGTSFSTPQISATTTYYVEAVNQSTEFVGAQYSGTSANGTNVGSHGIKITTTKPNITINSADIPFTGSGTITIALKDATNTTVIATSESAAVTGSGTSAVTVPFNLNIATPGNYVIVVTAVTGDVNNLGYATATYPYTTGDGGFSVTNGYWYGNSASNMYLFNLNVTTGCASPRQAVVATVNSAVPVVASTTTPVICSGGSASLSATSANAGYTYMWMPGSLSGATQSVSPTETTTYTVTATDSSTNCVTSQTVTVTVNPSPANFYAGADATLCAGGAAVALTSTGGTTIGTILSENFNGATNNWTATNNSTGGTVANAAWTLRPDGYNYASYGVNHSNDNSQFYQSNSDAQGSGSTTATILRSPAFSTVGYASADVSFYHHYYEPTTASSTGKVEVSTNGTDWTTLQTYDTTTGTYSAFAAASIPLPAEFLNQATVYLRFKYDGTWRYFWSIDNVSVSGQQNATVTWSPATGLYTDAAGTVAYTAGAPAAMVYAKPSATTTYTATAMNPLNCSATDTVVVTYSSTAAPTGNAAQTITVGGATLANLTATGTAIQWYAAATGGSPLASTTALVNGATYYASQTVNNCESQQRLAVTVTLDLPAMDWVNLQWPATATVNQGSSVDVYTQGWEPGVTDAAGAGTGIQVWIGVNSTNTNPSTWQTWIPATFNVQAGNNDEFTAAIGANLPAGTYYYASRWQLNNGNYVYGGYSTTGGGFWGNGNVSGVLTVNCNTAAPTAQASQTFCSAVELSVLQATGTNIQWYASANSNAPLAPTTMVTDGTMYYASQTVNGCESSTRTPVTVHITNLTVADPADVVACGSYALPALTVGNYYTGPNGTGNMLPAGTVITTAQLIYVYATSGQCSAEQMFGVEINNFAVQSPGNQTVCSSYTLPGLQVGNYYTAANGGGTMLPAGTVITSTQTLYVYGALANCTDEESFTITVAPVAAPTGQANQTVSVSDPFAATIGNLTVTATGTVTWYASLSNAQAGTDALSSQDVLVDGATYYAVQTVNNCSSAPFAVTVDVVLGNDSFDAAAFTYYPNPVKNVLNVKHSSEITSVTVFNLLGQQVLAKKVNATEGTIDMSVLADGPYVVNITAGGNVKTIKVVKKQ